VRDDHLAGFDRLSARLGRMLSERLTKVRIALIIGIVRVALLNRLDQRVLDVVGGRKVGIARCERDAARPGAAGGTLRLGNDPLNSR